MNVLQAQVDRQFAAALSEPSGCAQAALYAARPLLSIPLYPTTWRDQVAGGIDSALLALQLEARNANVR